jgi:uncharacterized protein (TIGR00251 family)
VSLLTVKVKPRSAHDRILGYRDGALTLSVTAPPLDGRANDAVCVLIAKALGIAKTRVRVVAGERARVKRLEVEGLTEAEIREVFLRF